MELKWHLLLATVTAAFTAEKECKCVDVDQTVALGHNINFQEPTLGGEFMGETCTMNCTMTASMNRTGSDPGKEYIFQIELTDAPKKFGDGVLWIYGMGEKMKIDRWSRMDEFVNVQPLNDTITMEFIEPPDNKGVFMISVEMVERKPGPKVSTNTALIVGVVCAVTSILSISTLVVFRFRKRLFKRQETMETYESVTNESFTIEEEESGVFSSKFLSEFFPQKIRGVGGYGCVFEAVNKLDNWKYAVKRIAIDRKDMDLALREVRAMAQLDHPHIVRYNGTWIEKPPDGWQHESDSELLERLGSPEIQMPRYKDNSIFIYIQMQLCNYSLSDWLGNNQDASLRDHDRMKSWFKQIVLAVCYIHKKNLIHRDLKPSNVLFADTDLLKLCDLGIVTERRNEEGSDTDITRTSVGTCLYMSPEQRSFRYSSKSDVFTLGLILAELSMTMTSDERTDIFHDYRVGKQCASIPDNKTMEFIALITQVDPSSRPSCQEMLDHSYLTSQLVLT